MPIHRASGQYYSNKSDGFHVYRTLDKDLDGFISSTEMRHYLTTLGETLSQEEIDELMKDADPNGEGKINYQEFCYVLLGD